MSYLFSTNHIIGFEMNRSAGVCRTMGVEWYSHTLYECSLYFGNFVYISFAILEMDGSDL